MGDFTKRLGKQQQTYRGFRLLIKGPDLDTICAELSRPETRQEQRCAAVIPRPWGVLQIFTFSEPCPEDELLMRLRPLLPDASRSELLGCGIKAPDQKIKQAIGMLSGEYIKQKKPSLARAFVINALTNKDNGKPLCPPELQGTSFLLGFVAVEDEPETDIVLGELVVLFRDHGWGPFVSFWASSKQVAVTVLYEEPCAPIEQ